LLELLILMNLRRSIRLNGFDYSQPNAYFVTLCSFRHKSIFGVVKDEEMKPALLGEIAVSCWIEIPDHFPDVELPDFVVMPNHIHGIINIVGARHAVPGGGGSEEFGKPRRSSLPTIIRSYKSAVTKRAHIMLATDTETVWQRNYYEHVIRDEEELIAIADYIKCNPALWKLDRENPDRIEILTPAASLFGIPVG
jgi:putative transposase